MKIRDGIESLSIDELQELRSVLRYLLAEVHNPGAYRHGGHRDSLTERAEETLRRVDHCVLNRTGG